MSVPPPVETYGSVADAEDDIHDRVDVIPGSEEWLRLPIVTAVMPTWTDVLTSFSVHSTVTQEEAIALQQIEATFDAIESAFQRRADVIGSGTMDTLEESHVLFIVLFRDIQRKTGGRANMNPHKLRVLLDGRYSVEGSG